MKRLCSSTDANYMAGVRQHLLSHGVPVSVSERGGELELWLHRPDLEPTAMDLLHEFDALPETQRRAAGSSGGSLLGPTWQNLSSQAGLLTFTVFIITLLVAGAQFFFSLPVVMSVLMITPPDTMTLTMSEPWRLVTPVFIHLSATHLVFNVFWWWYLGGRVELHLGAGHLFIIFMVTAISSNLLQWYTSGPLFGGLSGVVYGLLGFCTLHGWGRRTSLSLPNGLIWFMVGWLLLGYTDLLWVNVANEAHLMGLISGALLGLGYRFSQRTTGTGKS